MDKSTEQAASVYAVIPAAGSGSRFSSERPKQYYEIQGTAILETSARLLLDIPRVSQLICALSPGDHYWKDLEIFADTRVLTVDGGTSRAESVLNALKAMDSYANSGDWVLVHDSVRPFASSDDIQNLIEQCESQDCGGLLVAPVDDTIKQVNSEFDVEATVDRSKLRAAQTPQMFRYGKLKVALQNALDSGQEVTDEAMAIQRQGDRVIAVAGNRWNIKITRPEDLLLANYIAETRPIGAEEGN